MADSLACRIVWLSDFNFTISLMKNIAVVKAVNEAIEVGSEVDYVKYWFPESYVLRQKISILKSNGVLFYFFLNGLDILFNAYSAF